MMVKRERERGRKKERLTDKLIEQKNISRIYFQFTGYSSSVVGRIAQFETCIAFRDEK